VTVKLYVPTLESMSAPEVAGLLDETFELLWRSAPFEPADINIALVPSARPDDAEMGDRDAVRPGGVGEHLAIPLHGTEFFGAARSDLAEHYGPWSG
jgi:hypothetical protein